jgi:hypothetical protein
MAYTVILKAKKMVTLIADLIFLTLEVQSDYGCT